MRSKCNFKATACKFASGETFFFCKTCYSSFLPKIFHLFQTQQTKIPVYREGLNKNNLPFFATVLSVYIVTAIVWRASVTTPLLGSLDMGLQSICPLLAQVHTVVVLVASTWTDLDMTHRTACNTDGIKRRIWQILTICAIGDDHRGTGPHCDSVDQQDEVWLVNRISF